MRASSRELLVRCPAKLNLGLRILGRRPDGYHEIVTVYQAVTLWDTLLIRPAPRLSLRVFGRSLQGEGCAAIGPGGEAQDNLVMRAARLLAERTGALPGAEMVLLKRIPAGAGLGGGSSDAAGALLGLSLLWGLELNRYRMLKFASELGSDVPFFLLGGRAEGRGRGERLRRLEWRPGWYVVAVPRGARVSTAEAYACYAAGLSGGTGSPGSGGKKSASRMLTTGSAGDTLVGEADVRLPDWRENDLEPAAVSLAPAVAWVREMVAEMAGAASVTGSGAGVFAPAGSRSEALGMAAALRSRAVQAWVVAAWARGVIARVH